MPLQQGFHQFFEPWTFAGISSDPALAIQQLNERLRELAEKYSRLAQYLSFGPVPGSYQVLQFLIRDWNDASTAVAAGELSPAIVLPADCVPVALSVSTIDGSATVQLQQGTTELLTADLDSAAGTPYIASSEDFLVTKLEKDWSLNLEVQTVTGSPLAVLGTLWVNQFPKIQP